MNIKFPTSKLSSVGRVILIFSLAATTSLFAEPRPKKAKASTDSAASSSSQLRVWKDVFGSGRAIRVLIKPAKKGSPIDLHLPTDRQLLDYQEAPAGPVSVEITDEADPKAKLGTAQITLSESAFYTILLRETDDLVSIESINDTQRPGTSGELTIRNLAPTIRSLQIKVGDAVTATLDGADAFVLIRGLPRQASYIETKGEEVSGKALSWTNELDLEKLKKVTLLIFSDTFGRIRPRIMVDGQLSMPEEDPK